VIKTFSDLVILKECDKKVLVTTWLAEEVMEKQLLRLLLEDVQIQWFFPRSDNLTLS
jgi:hypothetical protein